MSDPVVIAIIVAIGGVVNSGLTLLIGKRVDAHAQAAALRSDAITSQLTEVHKEVNGQTERLLAVTGDARQAVGNLAGRAEAKAEAEK